jgi:uncharacterized protein (DUF2141 family)
MARYQERFSRAAKRGALAFATSAMLATAAHAGLVEIAVTGIAEARGHVRVELCTRTTFLTKDCPYQGVARAMRGETLVQISNVPPGEYAAQAFQDETDQGIVHQNLFGVPRERIGFSNDAPLRVKGPRFGDAAFSVGGEMRKITLKVKHLFGE